MKKFIKEILIYAIVILSILIIFNIKLPYYVNAPGGIIDISDRIEYNKKKEYKGSLNMLYVTEYIATIPIYLMSYVIPDWDLETIKNSQIADETTDEINVRNKIMLDNSANNAKYVAYKEAGKEITISKKEHQVIGTLTHTNLKIGDQILEVNNKEVDTLNDIKELISKSKINDELNFKIVRNDKEITISEKIKEIENAKALGVILVTDYEYKTNPDIELKFKGSESGSSGGLMMAISIYNAISDIDILKGRKIAGTGTIDIDGNVGEISGIKYKIIGAAKNDIDIVLVPEKNYEEARKVNNEKNYDLEIVSINNFKDAIDYLKK